MTKAIIFITTLITLLAAGFFVSYGVVVFISLEPNIFNWSGGVRALYLLGSLASFITISAFLEGVLK